MNAVERFCSAHLCRWCKGAGSKWVAGWWKPCGSCEGTGLEGGKAVALATIKIASQSTENGGAKP